MKPCMRQGGRSAHTTNNVPVPISASVGFLDRLRQPRLQQGTICGPRHNQRAKPKQRACHFIRLTPKGRAVVTALLAARKTDTQKQTKLAA
ncbi:MAG: hypothetical protein GX456_04315 [Verrucomicrobia bacterium]|nr:hypothetical protein [Verrucomicrobiota bacterium]